MCYVYFTNSEQCHAPWPSAFEGFTNYFTTGTFVRGSLHTNDTLHVSGDPIFYGAVTTVGSAIDYRNGGPPIDNPEFRQTLTTGVPKVTMPSGESYLEPIKEAAEGHHGHSNDWKLEGDTTITLDGTTMNVINEHKYGDTASHSESLPSSSAIYVTGGNVTVSGVLDGQLTIGTSRDIYIAGNVTYAADPLENPNSDDILGLVAKGNVVIASTAPFNAEMYAYIVTVEGGVSVENGETVRKGMLLTVGGATSNKVGIMGLLKGTTVISGYDEDKRYDERLAGGLNPPYFPVARDTIGTLYQKISWVDRGLRLE